ncbi:hypothetical protein DNHGIG_25890 [Collibacillus ludicampi]|uniref:Uncharacterized protein n=1 Tax=Collibacillus ludicampi TaxID=2771369 RepID=A0AAV4LGY0_9BACL|nr:hypothetical protein [Collibacillus ludicampi]GIM47040.1 hypothetical protein DNHGIG_25890 [Collibacillus ludicampi]
MDQIMGMYQAQPQGVVENQVMHEPAPAQPEQQPLAENQVRLSDGRIVEMREAVGSDEMIVAGQLGDVFEANGAGGVIFQTCLIARTITKIDGQPVQNLRGYESVRDFLAGFKAKDWNKIRALYNKLNGDDAQGND